MDHIAKALPSALATLTNFLSAPKDPLTDVQVMQAWELEFTLFAHTISLTEAIAQQSLHVDRSGIEHDSVSSISLRDTRISLLHSLRNMQTQVQSILSQRIKLMSFPPRLYRLATALDLSDSEIRAFIFIVLSCAGIEVPGAEDRRQGMRAKAELFNCREFAKMQGHQLLHFLSPSRKHFSQGLLEVEDEFAASYPDSKFRAPREVLKAIYGGCLTLDEAMTLGTSALSGVLAEEPDSVFGKDLPIMPSTKPGAVKGIAAVAVGDVFDDAKSNRDRTTDGTAMFELLSELRAEDEQRVSSHDTTNDTSDVHTTEDGTEEKTENGRMSPAGENGTENVTENVTQNGETSDVVEEEPEPLSDADIMPYADDMEYLKDGFEVVQEACKVYNFREKNSEEDRYTSTKRPVEALQREADAKLRKATMHFNRRLKKTKTVNEFMPRLELLVSKLKLVHFERMVIVTLGTPHAFPSYDSLTLLP